MFSEIQKKGSLVINGKKILLDDVSWIKPGRKIVYSGDCAPSENLIKVAKDADLLIHESTFANDKEDEAKERMHTTSKQAAMIAKQSNVKKLVLTHISPRYSEEESIKNLLGDAKSVFNNTIVANDGFILDV